MAEVFLTGADLAGEPMAVVGVLRFAALAKRIQRAAFVVGKVVAGAKLIDALTDGSLTPEERSRRVMQEVAKLVDEKKGKVSPFSEYEYNGIGQAIFSPGADLIAGGLSDLPPNVVGDLFLLFPDP